MRSHLNTAERQRERGMEVVGGVRLEGTWPMMDRLFICKPRPPDLGPESGTTHITPSIPFDKSSEHLSRSCRTFATFAALRAQSDLQFDCPTSPSGRRPLKEVNLRQPKLKRNLGDITTGPLPCLAGRVIHPYKMKCILRFV